MLWRPTFEKGGLWQWCCVLPNGWTCIVTDNSQDYFFQRETEYHVSATAGLRIAQSVKTYQTLAGAKFAALDLALKQAPVELGVLASA